MASSSDADEPNDAASSESLTEDTTATKKRSLNSSAGTLTPPSSSYSIVTLTSPLLPTLPFELIVEILSKLPVKSLMKFQCVCKSWKSLISYDPKFAKKHLRMSRKDHHLISSFVIDALDEFIYMDYPLTSLFTEVPPTAMELEYPLTNRRRFHLISGSCHGILCIAIGRGSVVLWNPSTTKFTKLPCLDETPRSLCRYDFSFGYDHSTDTYKVVALLCKIFIVSINGNTVSKIEVKVHTLGTNSWKTIQDFPFCFLDEESSGKFVSGTINWLAYNHPMSSRNLISLDLEKESYLEIVQPDYGREMLTFYKLGVLRECLCVFSHSYGDTCMNIWLMKEYGNKESWIKLFRVPDIRDPYNRYFCALYVSEDDQVLLEIESKLVVYNSRDGTFKDLNIQNTNGAGFIGERGTHVYHESLISPCF